LAARPSRDTQRQSQGMIRKSGYRFSEKIMPKKTSAHEEPLRN
jgi:hypothetical protein